MFFINSVDTVDTTHDDISPMPPPMIPTARRRTVSTLLHSMSITSKDGDGRFLVKQMSAIVTKIYNTE